MSNTIGIDLGTTFTCVEWIFKSSYSSSQEPFPSVVRIDKDKNETCGIAATSAFVKDGYYPFIDSKRFIGKRYKDCDLANCHYAFNIVDCGGYPFYERPDKRVYYSPKDISSKILKFIYNKYSPYVQADPGFQIENVVITVPAKFSTSQRKETREAGEMAGFNVLRLINEPTAAALAYIYDNNKKVDLNNKTILIYDFGGGTFDVAIIKVRNKDIYVLATGGDDHLGGQDITNNLIKRIIQKIPKSSSDEKIDEKTLYKIRKQCEEAKKFGLSQGADGEIDIHDESYTLTCSEMEELNRSLFLRTIDVVRETIECANLKKYNIDKVVMVGGSSNINKVKELLINEFGSDKILYQLNKDRIVAIGAAYYADSIVNYRSDAYTIHDIVNHSLGVECNTDDREGVMKKLIEKGEILPASGSFTFNNSDYAAKAAVRIYEGEDEYARNNTILSKYIIPLEVKKAGEIKIDLFLSVDNDGILTVTAKCNGKDAEVLIKK